jgi:hypothetical protein
MGCVVMPGSRSTQAGPTDTQGRSVYIGRRELPLLEQLLKEALDGDFLELTEAEHGNLSHLLEKVSR